MDISPDQYLPTQAAKDREREQVQKDVEAFLLAGGEIQHLPPAKVVRLNTANSKKSTE